MVNRIDFLNRQIERRTDVLRFGDLRVQQPLHLAPPLCAVPPLVAVECLDLLRGSIALSLLEKCHLLKRLSELPKEKIEGCISVWHLEQELFRNRPDEHQPKLVQLEGLALTDWWKVENWFWKQGLIAFEPRLWIGRADAELPPIIEHALMKLLPAK
jgi:hypothetical protein